MFSIAFYPDCCPLPLLILLWVWLAGLLMLILYVIMFAIICRWFKITHGIRWHNQPNRDAVNTESEEDKKIKAVANSMLSLVHFLFSK